MNKVALVTGASKGIGKILAVKLTQIGFDVMIVGRNKKQLLETKAEVENFNTNCVVTEPDLSITDAHLSIINRVIQEFGRLDVVINYAGGNSLSIKDTLIEMKDPIFKANTRTPYFICQEAILFHDKAGI